MLLEGVRVFQSHRRSDISDIPRQVSQLSDSCSCCSTAHGKEYENRIQYKLSVIEVQNGRTSMFSMSLSLLPRASNAYIYPYMPPSVAIIPEEESNFTENQGHRIY